MVQKLQLEQNMAACAVAGTWRFNSVGPLLQQLPWLPVHFWAQIKVEVLNFKALYSLGPGYLRDHLLPYNPTRTLRSSRGPQGPLLTVSPPAGVREEVARDRAFSVVWLQNSLPLGLRTAASLETFQQVLIHFYLRKFLNYDGLELFNCNLNSRLQNSSDPRICYIILIMCNFNIGFNLLSALFCKPMCKPLRVPCGTKVR